MFDTASSRHLLLVDVNPDTRCVTEKVLTSAGYRVTSVAEFHDGWEVMSHERPDLLLTTVRLGRFNGLHLALRSRATHPHLPIIVLGALADAGLEKDAAQFGARFLSEAGTPQVLALIAELLADKVA